MKIALTHFTLTTESGDPKMVLSIAQELKKLGHTVIVYCSEFNSGASFPRLNRGLDIRVVPPSKPLNSVLGATGAAAKILERIKRVSLYNDAAKRIWKAFDKDLDYIICENDYTYKAGYWYKQNRPGVRVIWIMNNPPFFHSPKRNIFEELLSWGANYFEKLSAKRYACAIDWIVVYDESFKRLAEALGRPVKMLRNPVDVDYLFAPAKTSIGASRRVQFLSMGALTRNRRYEDTIAAVKILREKGYDAKAVLICKDYWGDKKYREEFEQSIKNSGVAEWIDARFAGASEEEHLATLRESDVFVLPNNIKNWAVGAFEAMAAGLPLIVSRATAVADVLKDGEEVLCVDVLRPDDIAQKIEMLINDSALCARIAFTGQKRVLDEMSISVFVKGMLLPPKGAECAE